MCSDHMHTGSVQLFTHSVPSAFCFFEFSACKCAQLLPLHMSLYKPRLCPFAYVLLRLYETGCCLFSFAPSSCCSSIWLNFNKSWCIYVTQICIMRILKSPNKRFKNCVLCEIHLPRVSHPITFIYCFYVSVSFYLHMMSFSVTQSLWSFWSVVSLPGMNKGRGFIVLVLVTLAFLSHCCCPFMMHTEGPHTVCLK